MSNTKVLPLLEPDGESAAPCCPPLTERPLDAAEAETAARRVKALGVPVYQFLKAPLIRKYGEEFYQTLDTIAQKYYTDQEA